MDIASCNEEVNLIRGVIGDWEFAKDFWQYLKDHDIIKKDNFYSKEINYTFNLDKFETQVKVQLTFSLFHFISINLLFGDKNIEASSALER